MAPPSFDRFLRDYNKTDKTFRLGQYFVFKYIEGNWPEVFYGVDEVTIPLITEYLNNLQYYDTLPPLTNGYLYWTQGYI